ncbi:RIP metalloprotease [bacterium]|nr:MAG: RIP metalloprotease [bacterium]
MSDWLTPLLYVIGVGGMFLLLIAPHEAGHFLFAKLFKVRVIEFSIGAGMRLWSFTRGGTLYALRALPILGYVRMGGMEAGDFADPGGFHSKSPVQRIVILAGGPAANFLVAMVLIAGFGLTQLNSDPGKVFSVVPGSPAAGAGFQPGDSIRSVNGKPLGAPGLILQEEAAAPGAALLVGGVHAGGQPFTYVVVPRCDLQGHCQVGVGIARRLATVQTAITDGITFPFVATGGIVQGLWSLITGQVPGGLLGPQGLTGPIGIADTAAQAVSQGPPTYIFLVALLSVALGFTNLLPLLALDGGRIVVVVIEWLRRRPFDRTSELNFQRWGLVALLGMAAVISFLDIQRIATGQFPGVR